jgi:hypothetical protein
MNLRQSIECNEYLNATCQCSLSVGSAVTADGLRGRGVVTRRNGRRLTVQYRSGLRVERDQSFVHPLGRGPGE